MGITDILKILYDGEWHTLEEIQQKTELDRNKVRQVIEFLERYGFISVDKVTNKAVLDKNVQKFLVQKSNL
ncbi:hypothetical protein KAU55_05405 [Candidatus Bathyarchaeota archaeon]|nr:hypothetical protein [Candidatus Bathyarchaeota archaeon]